jgi:cytochrome c-type biogenesis protein CcmE
MVIKKKIFSTRTKLIILLAIFIILLGVVVILNLPPSIHFLTPNQVLSNQESYIDQRVIVKGYLDKNDNVSIITNTMDTTKTRDMLRVDYSKISNRDNLREGTLYYFTGIIKKDLTSPIILKVYLELEKFEAI